MSVADPGGDGAPRPSRFRSENSAVRGWLGRGYDVSARVIVIAATALHAVNRPRVSACHALEPQASEAEGALDRQKMLAFGTADGPL
jgi:hypothetical protein